MATYGPEKFATKTGKTIVFRHCEAGDIDKFLEFHPKIASETTNTLQVAGHIPDQEKIQEAWANSIKDQFALRVAAFSNQRMIGQLGFYSERQPPHPWTQHVGCFGMFVLQEFWGEGVGRRLLEIIETHARAVGITRIEATVRTKNERGVRLYSRMGYETEGTRKNAAIINGEVHDEFFIAKLLDVDTSWLPPVIETDRLVLRPLTTSDAPSIFEYASNPNVSRFTLWEPHKTIQDSESYVLDYALPYYRKNTPEPFGIALKENPQKLVGTVGCFWVSKQAKSMELAYALAEPLWGKGLVAEASRAALKFCCKEYDLTRMQARCKSENKASARVLEKIGMIFEGSLRSAIFHRGRYWDMDYYSILQNEIQGR